MGHHLATRQAKGRSALSRDARRARYWLTVLTSWRAAVVQLSLLAVVLVAAALIPQVSAETGLAAADPAAWAESQRRAFGRLYPAMQALSLFDIRDALWFRALLVLTGSSAASRLLAARAAREARVPPLAAFQYLQPSYSAVLPGWSETLGRSLSGRLRRAGYRPHTARHAGGLTLVGRRGALGYAGAPLAHAGIAVVLTAAWLGSMVSFRDTGLLVAEGDTVAVGHGTTIALRLSDVTVRSYSDANVTSDLVSKLDVLDRGSVVLRDVQVRVNRPLSYRGVRVLQMDAGHGVRLTVTGRDGGGESAFSVPLNTVNAAGQPTGVVPLGVRVLTVSAAAAPRAAAGVKLVLVLPDGETFTGDASGSAPVTLGPTTVRLVREVQFSRLQASSQPAAPYVWLGGTAVLLGIALSFLFTPRRVVIHLHDKTGSCQVTAVRLQGPVSAQHLRELVEGTPAAKVVM